MKEVKVDKRFCGSKKKARQAIAAALKLNEWIRWFNLNKRRW